MRDNIILVINPVCLPDKLPEIKVTIGNFSFQSLIESSKTLQLPLTQRHNELTVELINKKGEDTKVKNNQVVADLAIEIQSLTYRTFDFKPYLNKIATYTTYDNKSITGTHGYMSFAGKMKIPLESPLFLYSKNLTLHNHFEEHNE